MGKFKTGLTITGLALAALLGTGCTTMIDKAQVMATNAVAPKAKQNPDGNYVVPTFSTPETGLKFSTASPSQAASTFRQMTNSLPKNEKVHLTRVILSLSHYHGCVEHGYKSASHSTGSFTTKKKSSQCNVVNFYMDSQNFANTLLSKGRPDNDRLRTVQTTLAGAPIGDAKIRGTTDAGAWQKWINYSGYKLDGKTRTDLMQEFLQGTNGALAWQRF